MWCTALSSFVWTTGWRNLLAPQRDGRWNTESPARRKIARDQGDCLPSRTATTPNTTGSVGLTSKSKVVITLVIATAPTARRRSRCRRAGLHRA